MSDSSTVPEDLAPPVSLPAAPRLRFLHAFCNDVPAMRDFYADRLGLPLLNEMDEAAYGWLVFDVGGGLQLMFHRWDDGPLPEPAGWAWQPGDGQGDLPVPSQGLHVPEAAFAATVERLRAAGDPVLSPVPTWRQDSYWGWTVRDPSGNMLEIYTSPAERPAGDPPTWPS